MSWPKYLMEQHLGRKLEDWETVDHINRDHTDDRIENLRVVSRSQHSTDDAVLALPVEIVCVLCGNVALKSGRNLRGNSKQGKAGPFCSRSCAGKYGTQIQNKSRAPLPPQPGVVTQYYRPIKKI